MSLPKSEDLSNGKNLAFLFWALMYFYNLAVSIWCLDPGCDKLLIHIHSVKPRYSCYLKEDDIADIMMNKNPIEFLYLLRNIDIILIMIYLYLRQKKESEHQNTINNNKNIICFLLWLECNQRHHHFSSSCFVSFPLPGYYGDQWPKKQEVQSLLHLFQVLDHFVRQLHSKRSQGTCLDWPCCLSRHFQAVKLTIMLCHRVLKWSTKDYSSVVICFTAILENKQRVRIP